MITMVCHYPQFEKFEKLVVQPEIKHWFHAVIAGDLTILINNHTNIAYQYRYLYLYGLLVLVLVWLNLQVSELNLTTD